MSASQVKELRERTGPGLLECKKALAAAGGGHEAGAARCGGCMASSNME